MNNITNWVVWILAALVMGLAIENQRMASQINHLSKAINEIKHHTNLEFKSLKEYMDEPL